MKRYRKHALKIIACELQKAFKKGTNLFFIVYYFHYAPDSITYLTYFFYLAGICFMRGGGCIAKNKETKAPESADEKSVTCSCNNLNMIQKTNN